MMRFVQLILPFLMALAVLPAIPGLEFHPGLRYDYDEGHHRWVDCHGDGCSNDDVMFDSASLVQVYKVNDDEGDFSAANPNPFMA